MKKSTKIAIISSIAVAVTVSVLAVTVHLRILALEGNEGNSNESASQKIGEIVNSVSNPSFKENKTSNSEANESTQQRASEGNP